MKKIRIPLFAVLVGGAGFSFDLAAQTTPAPQPSICNRSCWAARAGSCGTALGTLNRAIIHHTAGPSDYTTNYETGKARMRANQNYHMDSNGWCDIGYHFLVNAAGHIYEGRAGSLSGTALRGAHDGCNANSMGFTALGYYHTPYNHAYTQALQDGLSAVIAWKMPSGWSPHGSGTYCGVSVGTLDGHYMVKATACPGTLIINGLGATRNNVAARRTPYINPPYLFGSGPDGWFAGNSTTPLAWTASGWPGIIYTDQVGNDPFIYGPAASFGGSADSSVNVSVYPQNGSTANHDMQVFWKTDAENFWDAAKSSPVVNYTAQNSWTRINLNVSNAKWTGQVINQLRLDFDQANQGNRWIVNHIYPQVTPKYWFGSSASGWTLGNGLASLGWTATGWPGIIYADQVGNDAFFYSPVINHLGGANDVVRVNIYPQNGGTANHEIQVFWKTASDNTWTAGKSSAVVNYTAQNAWADLTIPVGNNPSWYSDFITQIRLDVDNTHTGVRWIIDYVTISHQ